MSNEFSVQAYNNAWSNLRLTATCAELSSEALSQTRTGFFPSIIATLNHIHIVDLFYVSALEGQCIGLAAFDPLIPYPDLTALTAAQREIDQRLINLCLDPHLAKADRPVTMTRAETRQTERFDRTFLHLIQHQIHHRGQVHCMLSGTSASPPQLDEFYMAWEADKSLRASDLRALDVTEEDIWRNFPDP